MADPVSGEQRDPRVTLFPPMQKTFLNFKRNSQFFFKNM